jgi:large subunit ribosomal protein L10
MQGGTFREETMDKDTKIAKSQVLREQIEDVSALVLVQYERLTVASADDLRNRFREAGCTYRVYKNSTIRWAVEGTNHQALQPLLKGVTGLAYNADDPGAPARVVRDFAKDNKDVQLKGGIIDGDVLDADACLRLASMLGPRELKAKLLMLFNTPGIRMLQVMQAGPRDFLRVLNAKKDKDEAA